MFSWSASVRVGFQKGILRSATGVFSIPFKDTGARITSAACCLVAGQPLPPFPHSMTEAKLDLIVAGLCLHNRAVPSTE